MFAGVDLKVFCLEDLFNKETNNRLYWPWSYENMVWFHDDHYNWPGCFIIIFTTFNTIWKNRTILFFNLSHACAKWRLWSL